MRVKEMHPLCCISLETIKAGDQSPNTVNGSIAAGAVDVTAGVGSSCDINVAGVLYKWTNYGKGWRSRWFLLKDGVISYSKIRRSEGFGNNGTSNGDEVCVIGNATSEKTERKGSSSRLNRSGSFGSRWINQKTVGFVHLKISSFRESRSDDRRFYIFTATKTLHLRTNSKKDRLAWIHALVSTRNLFSLRPLNDKLSLIPNDITLSTRKLRERLFKEGISEPLINDCEQIMLSEFSQCQGQLKVLCEERSNLFDTLRQLEAANIEVESSGVHVSEFQLTTGTGHGKFSECSTTESSEDIERRELEEISDEEDTLFFDAKEFLTPCQTDHVDNCVKADCVATTEIMYEAKEYNVLTYPHVERRKKLPTPIEKEKGVNLWSMIKDNVGKDLTRVCLPVYFNEPISSLQKCFEELEYSHLLDEAYKYGREGNSLLRVLNVAAFAISAYASSEGRPCKPFNPMLGETYEADYPDKGIRFFSEKVSHHPMLIACHCEGRGWKFWGDSNLRTKFWGRSIQLDPVGVLTLEFDDGEIFQWSKVTTSIYNLILGKVYCDHHGTMDIRGNRQHSCKVKFKEQSFLDRNPHQIQGLVEDVMGTKVASLFGKWDDSVFYVNGDGVAKPRGYNPQVDAKLLWRRNKPPPNLTRYNLTLFAITVNELTSGLQEKLPPTDSRLRPDQRHLENGEYEKANSEKLRLETRQRMSRKMQENGWKPRWFRKDGESGAFLYEGGYWEAREQRKWDGCPNIFGEFVEDVTGLESTL